ncbi:hypothetical protein [Lacihabitans soyangensis]|uniref:hypothetical protein n=1 Tax=Lacihabitans soyangensis TaxID=869394 RepID=UPI0020CF5544|nr:hypothetical protein [Lacihabitans soyangensis]
MAEVELLLEVEPPIELQLVLEPEVGVIPGLANYIGLPGPKGEPGEVYWGSTNW